MVRFSFLLRIFFHEGKLFFRQSKYGKKGVFASLFFVNFVSGSLLFLTSLNIVYALNKLFVPEDVVYNVVLLFLNSLFVYSIIFGTLESIALFSRESDQNFLTSLPVSTREIVWGKTFWIFISLLFYVIFPFFSLFYPLRTLFSSQQLILIFSLSLFLIFIGSSLSVLICFALFTLSSPSSLKSKFSIIVGVFLILSLLLFNTYFVAFPANPQSFYKLLLFKSENPLWYFSPASWSFYLIKGTVANPLLKPFSITFLSLTSFMLFLFLNKYSNAWFVSLGNKFSAPPHSTLQKRKYFNGYNITYTLLSRLIGEKIYYVFLNETRLTFRENFRLLNMVIFVLLLVPVLAPLYKGSFLLKGKFFPLFHLLINIIPIYVAVFCSQSIGWEGKSFMLIKKSPIKNWELFLGKFLFYLCSDSALILIFSFLIILQFPFNLFEKLTLIFSPLIASVGVLLFSMWVGVTFPNFEGEVTGLLGSRKEGVNLLGSLTLSTSIVLFFFGPVLFLTLASINNYIPLFYFSMPSLLTIFMGLLTLRMSLQKIEILEV